MKYDEYKARFDAAMDNIEAGEGKRKADAASLVQIVSINLIGNQLIDIEYAIRANTEVQEQISATLYRIAEWYINKE